MKRPFTSPPSPASSAASPSAPSHPATSRTARAGVPGPAVQIAARHLTLDASVCASFAVVGYPREVGPGWLEPLLTYPGRLDVALHIEPIPQMVAADRLRRQLARLEATSHADADRGRLVDFAAEAAAEDAYELASRLARGQGRLFRLGLYLTVHAPDQQALSVEAERVRALAASMLLDAKPATFRALSGWLSTLPIGLDLLKMRRAFDTAALAAAFPFTSPDLTAHVSEHPVLYGVNADSSSLVLWDRFAQDNHNSVILARSGAGKSYLAKLEILRSLYCGVHVMVVDPEDEYGRLAAAVGGLHINLGAPGIRLNPFELPPGAHNTPDALTRQALFIHTLTAVLLGQPPSPTEKAALDRAILAAYHAAGITTDPRTWTRPAPVLADLAGALSADPDTPSVELAGRLAPYVTGTHKGLFDGPTTIRPAGHLLVFGLRDLPEEIKPAGVLLTLEAIWRQVADPYNRRPRLVVVDEGWLLMRQDEGARFLFKMAKSARKHWAGLTVITQDAADVLGTPLGQAVVANAATQILLRQAPQAIDAITTAFGLSDGERHKLLAARRGTGLLVSGTSRVSFEIVASAAEHALATTDPAELEEM
jgi:type IV secretory pathway VirB4 component